MGAAIAHAGLLLSGVAIATQAVLSATNKGSNLTLINPNLVESTASSTGVCLSDTGKTTGKFYAEVKCTQIRASASAIGMGVRAGTASLNNYVGQESTSWGTWCVGSGGRTRSTYNNAVATVAAVTGNNGLNQTARIAVDIAAGKIWLSQFGSTSWIGGGDPAAGTSPTFTFTPGGSTYYLALTPREGAAGVDRSRLQLVLPLNWLTTAPSGFGVWT